MEKGEEAGAGDGVEALGDVDGGDVERGGGPGRGRRGGERRDLDFAHCYRRGRGGDVVGR